MAIDVHVAVNVVNVDIAAVGAGRLFHGHQLELAWIGAGRLGVSVSVAVAVAAVVIVGGT